MREARPRRPRPRSIQLSQSSCRSAGSAAKRSRASGALSSAAATSDGSSRRVAMLRLCPRLANGTLSRVFALAQPAPLICLDPGHGTIPAIGRETEPIGPGSTVRKIKDGGGAPGEAPVALAIALRTRALLQRDGYRVAMTRTGPTYAGGNIARARFCNVRRAALMIRIHADGSTDSSQHGV